MKVKDCTKAENIKSCNSTKINTKPLLDINSAIITISDRASKGIYKDLSGPIIKDTLIKWGSSIQSCNIVSDDSDEIFSQIKENYNKFLPDLIITTGGTGLCERDNTSCVIESICDYIIPGIGEALRYEGSKFSKCAWTSRCIGGVINKTLIISIPGSPDAVKQSLEILVRFVPHAVNKLQN